MKVKAVFCASRGTAKGKLFNIGGSFNSNKSLFDVIRVKERI